MTFKMFKQFIIIRKLSIKLKIFKINKKILSLKIKIIKQSYKFKLIKIKKNNKF